MAAIHARVTCALVDIHGAVAVQGNRALRRVFGDEVLGTDTATPPRRTKASERRGRNVGDVVARASDDNVSWSELIAHEGHVAIGGVQAVQGFVLARVKQALVDVPVAVVAGPTGEADAVVRAVRVDAVAVVARVRVQLALEEVVRAVLSDIVVCAVARVGVQPIGAQPVVLARDGEAFLDVLKAVLAFPARGAAAGVVGEGDLVANPRVGAWHRGALVDVLIADWARQTFRAVLLATPVETGGVVRCRAVAEESVRADGRIRDRIAADSAVSTRCRSTLVVVILAGVAREPLCTAADEAVIQVLT